MSDEITIRYVEPNDFMDMWRLQHKHHFHKKGLYSKEVFAFICRYCPDSQVAVMNGKIVGYHIAVMRWNEGHLDSMDMVFEPRGHFGLGLFYEHLEKSNYPRWTGGVSEDNINMFKSARDKWRTKEVSDSLKAVGTSVSTIMVNVWNIVPEALGALLIVLNIIYIILKIKKEY